MENKDYLCTENESSAIMDFKETFKRFGTNASKMAEKMGLSQQNLQGQLSRGSINIRQLEEMAKHCGVSLGEFVGAEAPKELILEFGGKKYKYALIGETE